MSKNKKKPNPVTILVGVFVALAGIWVVATLASSDGARAPQVTAERLARDPVLGNPDAPVQIVEYGAYSCQSCQALHQSGVLERIIEEFDGQVAFVYRDFPVIIPNYDQVAAEAAQCALDQSEEGFWAYHDRLYTTDYVVRKHPEDFGALAAEIGLDGNALETCVRDDVNRRTVEHDLNKAQRLGLRGTPSLFINDEPLFTTSYEGIKAAVEAELAGR